MLTEYQQQLVSNLRSDIDRLTMETPRTTAQRDYLAKLAADVLRIQRQVNDRDARDVAMHLEMLSIDTYLREPDNKPGTFAVFEQLFKKQAGGHFKTPGELRQLLTETFALIEAHEKPKSAPSSGTQF